MFNIKIVLTNATKVEIKRQQSQLDAGTYKGEPKFSIPGLLDMNDYYIFVIYINSKKDTRKFFEELLKKF